ncbi:DUF1360 domain-containing protein [Neobacillus rhizophilus]|uniref:DUF1360 domain-containing protein n=1 Tax=Neobacillus rhizophilus TaxID=2833579 RepID=A0A942U6Y3_9BACI|nr:DUF1360 domain-containing protein [Neobacillus rhizophilus]MBS4213632.1 DUF1360 domain-containing protein [Neobacillus rhizophilus]MBU8917962.1 DUF1360 domain-containing protein [Bacillus sp. FJAT-29953]
MKDISWMTYIMLILASYRFTHLIVFDKITESIRRPFMKKVEVKMENGEVHTKEVPKSLFGYLLKCYWCAGVWSAIILGGAYLIFPKITLVFIFIFSIAGGQSIIETFVGVNIKKVDYYSELKKKDN